MQSTTSLPFSITLAPQPPSTLPSPPLKPPYFSTVVDPYHRFDDIRKHSTKEICTDVDGAGEALFAYLPEVPALYFNEDFRLEEGATFRATCPFSSISENAVLQEKLSQYLDVVELHLVKEISLRSSLFATHQSEPFWLQISPNVVLGVEKKSTANLQGSSFLILA